MILLKRLQKSALVPLWFTARPLTQFVFSNFTNLQVSPSKEPAQIQRKSEKILIEQWWSQSRNNKKKFKEEKEKKK